MPDNGLSCFTHLSHNPYLLTRPDREIRPLMLLGLGGLIRGPFCHGYKVAVDVVDGATLTTEDAMESAGFGNVLFQAVMDVAE